MSEKPLPTKYRINGRSYKPHPAADCFPLLAGTPYRDLVDDIRVNGMAVPILILGDYVLDGRSRLLAAEELRLQHVSLTHLPKDTDAIALVASLNIHRRHLNGKNRTLAAARLLALSHAAFRANFPDEPDPDALESPLAHDGLDDPPSSSVLPAEPPRPAPARVPAATRQSEPSLPRSASSASRALAAPSTPADPVLSEDVADDPAPVPSSAQPDPDSADASSLPAGLESLPDLTDGASVLSVRKVAAAYDANGAYVHRARRLLEKCPDLGPPLTAHVITVNDASRIQFEPEDVRRQAVADVEEGRASTAVRAIRQRFARDPVPDPDAPPDPSAAQPAPVQAPPPGEIAAPPAVLAFVRNVMGDIAYDPCSAAWCAEQVGAAAWCGVEDDGLTAEWQGAVWVFPPPELADPFISKTLLELEEGRVCAAALLVPMAPWTDAARLAFGSPHLHALVVPSSPITCRRPDGAAVCPDEPLWILLFGQMRAPAIDVAGSLASTVLVPQARS